ncbi:MAG TPA: helix-turn-helix transcriptional regulator [Pseudonocardiaceae bacterium]
MLRMTLPTRVVLQALVEDPAAPRYGLELSEATGLPTGTIYPILARLERARWLTSSWEDPSVHEAAGRPRRRFYRLTEDGAVQAATALARAGRSRRGAWGTRPATGAGS